MRVVTPPFEEADALASAVDEAMLRSPVAAAVRSWESAERIACECRYTSMHERAKRSATLFIEKSCRR